MSNTLEISNLSKSYKGFHLQNVSFNLPTGYIMGLIGPNGAGKTTIIKIILNLVMKQEGSIKVFGLDHQKDEVAIKKRIGFVFDTPAFYPHLNLKQLKNVVAPFYEQWDDAKFEDLVDRFALPLNKPLKQFSRGMNMKASIAIALSHHADFIIMDEPTSGLDPVIRREMLDVLRGILQDENKSILFSSHVTSDIEQAADFITYVNQGQLVFSKTKDDVNESFAIVKGGNDLLNSSSKKSFVAVREGEFGFEGLTEDVHTSKKIFGEQAVYEKASLEDIMFYHNQQFKSTN